MVGSTHRGPVEPPFGCSAGPGFRPIGEVVDTVVSRIAHDNDGRTPRYVAEGREIVTVHTGRRQSPPRAREAAQNLFDGALANRDDGLADSDLRSLADIVRAIRAAERSDPLPPAAIAEAA